jgi:predicted lactoylglutathione lyase
MTTTTSRKMFVNLAVKDLAKTVDFFTRLGFEFDPRFTDENATCMIVNDDAFVMLLVEDFFKNFTKKGIADATTQNEAIMALSADSKQQVDDLVDRALAAGGQASADTTDQGFMYERSFQDLDGHLWSAFWMDPSALEQAPEQ